MESKYKNSHNGNEVLGKFLGLTMRQALCWYLHYIWGVASLHLLTDCFIWNHNFQMKHTNKFLYNENICCGLTMHQTLDIR